MLTQGWFSHTDKTRQNLIGDVFDCVWGLWSTAISYYNMLQYSISVKGAEHVLKIAAGHRDANLSATVPEAANPLDSAL